MRGKTTNTKAVCRNTGEVGWLASFSESVSVLGDAQKGRVGCGRVLSAPSPPMPWFVYISGGIVLRAQAVYFIGSGFIFVQLRLAVSPS